MEIKLEIICEQFIESAKYVIYLINGYNVISLSEYICTILNINESTYHQKMQYFNGRVNVRDNLGFQIKWCSFYSIDDAERAKEWLCSLILMNILGD